MSSENNQKRAVQENKSTKAKIEGTQEIREQYIFNLGTGQNLGVPQIAQIFNES